MNSNADESCTHPDPKHPVSSSKHTIPTETIDTHPARGRRGEERLVVGGDGGEAVVEGAVGGGLREDHEDACRVSRVSCPVGCFND